MILLNRISFLRTYLSIFQNHDFTQNVNRIWNLKISSHFKMISEIILRIQKSQLIFNQYSIKRLTWFHSNKIFQICEMFWIKYNSKNQETSIKIQILRNEYLITKTNQKKCKVIKIQNVIK